MAPKTIRVLIPVVCALALAALAPPVHAPVLFDACRRRSWTLLQRHQGGGHGPARRLGRGRTLPPPDGRVEPRAGTRSRSAAPTATARSGSAWACARPAGTSRRSSTTRRAPALPKPPTSARPGWPTSSPSCPATRSCRFPKLGGTFDFVFLDAWKRDYKRFFDLVFPRLEPRGLFLAHNVVNKQSEMRDFLAAIHDNPKLFTSIVTPSGEGMSISFKLP